LFSLLVLNKLNRFLFILFNISELAYSLTHTNTPSVEIANWQGSHLASGESLQVGNAFGTVQFTYYS